MIKIRSGPQISLLFPATEEYFVPEKKSRNKISTLCATSAVSAFTVVPLQFRYAQLLFNELLKGPLELNLQTGPIPPLRRRERRGCAES